MDNRSIRDFSKSIKEHPIWSAVIAGLIIAALLALAKFAVGLFPAFSKIVKAIGGWMLQVNEIRNYEIVLGLLFALVLIALLMWLKSRWPFSSKARYTEDQFYGMLWRWKCDDGQISEIKPFCPKCDMELTPQRCLIESGSIGSSFSCDCGDTGVILETDARWVSKSIRLRIEKNLRTGEWRDAKFKK